MQKNIEINQLPSCCSADVPSPRRGKEEDRKCINFCNTYTTLYVIQYITQYKYKKKQYEKPTCCPAHVSSPGRGVEEAANICCTKNKYKTMMRPVTITLGHPIPELEH